MRLMCVAPELARQAVPLVESHIRPAVASVAMSDPDDIIGNVLKGDALLWLVVDGMNIHGAVVTELQVHRDQKNCVIVAYGSNDHGRCAHLISELEDFARAEHCASMRLYGRKGWLRRLPDYALKA